MSRTRHDAEPLVRGYAVTHPPGRTALADQAGWDHLIYTAAGTLTVRAGDHLWTVPPHRALWLPDGAAAEAGNRYRAAVRTLYFAAHLRAAPDTASVVTLWGFPRELLLYVVRVCPLTDADDSRRALLTVLLDQLRDLPAARLALPVPREPATRRAAEMLRADPDAELTEIARAVGMSRRTLERRFTAETGIALGAWRRRARLLGALEPLAAGVPVARVGVESGYSTASAFVTAFTGEFGESPRNFLRGGG